VVAPRQFWVNFLANNQELSERLGFNINPAVHRPAPQSGCLTPCVICDAPESESESVGSEPADPVDLQWAKAVRQSMEHPYTWCWTEEAEARWESEQAEM
jgi:hypothetical protein